MDHGPAAFAAVISRRRDNAEGIYSLRSRAAAAKSTTEKVKSEQRIDREPGAACHDNPGFLQLPSGSQQPCVPAREGRTFYRNGLLGIAMLVALYIGFGIVGHEPWKADEAYIFGIIHSMLEDDSWLVPLVAGEPFMEKPPLYAWVGAGLVKLLGHWLTAPDAARVASAMFMALSCWSLAGASHRWWGNGLGRYAPVLLCSCIGVLVQSHMMMPDVALLAGVSISLWGFSFILARPLRGGLLLGLGAGLAFLAKGLLGPGVIGLSALLLPLLSRSWRTRAYGTGLLAAAAIACPLLVVWPVLLYLRSPTLFASWFWDNNFGRFLGSSIEIAGTEKPAWFWPQTLPWFAFPALPLALCTLVFKRRQFVSHTGMQCMAVCAGVVLATLSTSAAARSVYAFPLLAPVAVLGVPAIFVFGRTLERAWVACSAAVFGALVAAVWTVWLIMMHTGHAPAWPWLNRWLPADFVPHFDGLALMFALPVTIAGAWAVWRLRRQPGAGAIGWMTGMTVAWAVITTLAMPWIDYAKSYRIVFGSIPWPDAHRCITSSGLGESERAMLDYYADRLTSRQEIHAGKDCDLILVQGSPSNRVAPADPGRWEMIWSGARPGDQGQKFWLYRAKPAPVTVHEDEALHHAHPAKNNPTFEQFPG